MSIEQLRQGDCRLNRIGLIADSHGSIAALNNCINLLTRKKPDVIVHLGDFCDSVHFEKTFEIIRLMESFRIIPVKGNNDYQVEKMLQNSYSFNDISENRHVFSYLKKLPRILVNENICFSHSMPYDTDRAFYEPVDNGTTNRAVEIFDNTDYDIIFCGHSHTPVLFRHASGRTTREKVSSGRPTGMLPGERYIIIIGSAENGECGLYDTAQSRYELLRSG